MKDGILAAAGVGRSYRMKVSRALGTLLTSAYICRAATAELRK